MTEPRETFKPVNDLLVAMSVLGLAVAISIIGLLVCNAYNGLIATGSKVSELNCFAYLPQCGVQLLHTTWFFGVWFLLFIPLSAAE